MKKQTKNLEFLHVPRRPMNEKNNKSVKKSTEVNPKAKVDSSRTGATASVNGMTKAEALKFAYTRKFQRPSSTKRRNVKNKNRKGRKLVSANVLS